MGREERDKRILFSRHRVGLERNNSKGELWSRARKDQASGVKAEGAKKREFSSSAVFRMPKRKKYSKMEHGIVDVRP